MSSNYRQDYKKLLSPEFISKINTLDLKARMVVEGFMIGMHKSPYHGFSVEFSEHRQYMPGDEISKIDWKVFAKTDKYYLKQYEEETNLRSFIILDNSRSMAYSSGSISKYQYGVTLAASLSYLMINQNDAVGLSLYSNKIDKFMPPRSTTNYLLEIFKVLSENKVKEQTDTSKSLNEVAEKIKKRGLVIIISDFFDDIDSVISSIKRFKYLKNEIIVFQILDEKEILFDFEKDSIFKDLESNEELLTIPIQIKKSYQEAFTQFRKKLETECKNNNIDYNLITTKSSYDKALLAYLKKRKKLH